MQLYVLMFGHWVGDFVFQNSWMALNKARNWKALFAHVAVYSAALLFFAAFVTSSWSGLAAFAGVNFALHLFIDAISSRISQHFWLADDKHKFFTTIGFDQFLHFACLAATSHYFL